MSEELEKIKKDFEEYRNETKEILGKVLKELKELRKQSVNKLDRPFEMLYIPSKGLFYSNKTPYLFVNLLTYHEEYLLTSPMLVETGFALDVLLRRVIANEDINVDELLPGDVQAISMFLRAYAYGDTLEDIEVECPHCSRKTLNTFRLSDFKTKDIEAPINENKEIEIHIPKYEKVIKIKPRNYKEEREFEEKNKNSKEQILQKMKFYITEINGERDPRNIERILRTIKILESREIRKLVFENLPGVQNNVDFVCSECDKHSKINFGTDYLSFLKFPLSYRNNMNEEVFLLNHYGEIKSVEEIKNMTVFDRRWMINRTSEELKKKREAEEREVRKARSKSKR
jgi:DNA-directed RNA polymerase subunit RPC12/RpoP